MLKGKLSKQFLLFDASSSNDKPVVKAHLDIVTHASAYVVIETSLEQEDEESCDQQTNDGKATKKGPAAQEELQRGADRSTKAKSKLHLFPYHFCHAKSLANLWRLLK